LYAAATKTGALYGHHKQSNVRWHTVALLASGSIPASLITAYGLKSWIPPDFDYSPILTHSLGVMLIITAFVVFFKNRIRTESESADPVHTWVQRHASTVTVIAGILLGILVTLSSVGAGAFCAALLLTLYPRWPALRVVGTDIAHAVPLTLFAGMGHLWNGNVDFQLLGGLLIGSLPAVHFGTKLAARVPNGILQPVLAGILLLIGTRFAFFAVH